MKKIIPVLLFVLVSAVIAPAHAYRKPAPIVPTVPGSVCIDPGHGGTETGAVYTDPATGEILYQESQINLDVALKLRDLLDDDPDRVIFMTRDNNNVTLDNRARYTACNDAGAAILVSIHHNGSTDPTMNYSMSLYKKDVDVPLAWTVVNAIHEQFPEIENKGVSLFTSGVLLKSAMPATISEAFFLTNENVVEMIEEKDALDKEALGLSNAINNYFSAQ